MQIKPGVVLLYTFLLMLFTNTVLAQDKKLNILTLGDSNGTYTHSWPKQLQLSLSEARIYNISKSGRTIGFLNLNDKTLNSLEMIDINLKIAADSTGEIPYDYVILELGTNDAKAVFANRQAEVPTNLEKLIQKIRACDYGTIKNAKIIIISPPPYGAKANEQEKYKGGDARVKEMSKTFKEIAKKNSCIFVNGYETPGLDINTMTSDGLHLDAEGSKKLIEPVLKIIQGR